MEYRVAAARDIPQLIRLRRQQLLDEGMTPVEGLAEELERWFQIALADGSLYQILVTEGEEAIATGAVIFYSFPPIDDNLSGWKGYVANMYTAPPYRGQGVATRLLNLLREETLRRGVTRMLLGASQMGRPVYARFGFVPDPIWMELSLDQP